MNCQSCSREIVPDTYFCTWCSAFVPAPTLGTKPGLFGRWIALVIDPFIAIALYLFGVGVLASVSRALGTAAAVLLPVVYIVWFLNLLRQGLTPGKKVMGLQVVQHQTGQIPGFGKMLVREVVGRFLSALFLGLGYFWAIFDKNGQAWHDKLAGTVVLKRSNPAAGVAAPAGAIIGERSATVATRRE